MNLQKLIEKHPLLWQKICEKYQDEEVRKNAFLAQIYRKIAKEKEMKIRELERKRRTRALIIFAGEILEKLATGKLKIAIRDGENYKLLKFEKLLEELNLMKKERGKEIDYTPYILKEYRKHATAS